MSASKRGPGYEGQRQIHQALGHSMRLALLSDLLEDGPTSASQFAKKHDLGERDLERASYHLKVLAKSELVVLKEENLRRGAKERLFEINSSSPVLDMALVATNVSSEASRKKCAEALLKVVHLDVDDHGVAEVKEAIREFRAHLDQADAASRQRLDSTLRTLKPLRVVYTDVG